LGNTALQRNLSMATTQTPWGGSALPEDVARFTSIADSWWDPNSAFAPLHTINPLRVSYIQTHICAYFGYDKTRELPLKGLSILDIGCGGGLLCEPLAQLGAEVTGIDAGSENIKAAKVHAQKMALNIIYRHALPEELAKEQSRYDVVINMEVLEHVSDIKIFLQASAALVRPGGAMALSTLNRTLKSLVLAKIGAEYILRWVPIGTHNWQQFVKPSELASGLRANGVLIEDLTGMIYNPLSGKWELSLNLAVNYLAFAGKPE
jgi:2-polyprenyl-6-hydroxyphenyl methylase/3-demethylubiquinone-9 3-methyltransferase